MKQKDYKLEIINELLKSKNHIRSLAKLIGTNPMTISRKVKELAKENVVDFNEEGKNKVYFLKKSLESRAYIMKTENYKLVKIIGKYPILRNIFENIQKNTNIRIVILFGSYAKRIAKPRSDIDIFVETKDKKIKRYLEQINSKINVKIGQYDKENLLAKEIEKNHVIIKGAEEYYEKNKFFE